MTHSLICDTCGRVIRIGDARYSLADKPEDGRGRHWECQQTSDPFTLLRGALEEVALQVRDIGLEDDLPPRRPRQ